MSRNYVEIQSWNPFVRKFAYTDVKEYYADDLFLKYGIAPKFKEEWSLPDTPIIVIFCSVRNSETVGFQRAMADMSNKMAIMGYPDYDQQSADLFDMIEQGEAPRREYDDSADRIHNLTLYLQYVEEHAPELFEEMNDHFDGMPGYAPP